MSKKKVKINFNLKNDLNKIRLEANKFMILLGSDVKRMIIKRTQRGKDLNNRKFTNYSKPYLKYKKKKGLPTSPVNLTFRFNMLANMTVRKLINGSKVYFSSSDERKKAYYNNFGIGVPKREFFGLSIKERKDIYRRLSKKIGELI